MKISGNKLFVEALKQEGVEYLFGYQGACVMDIFDELYQQDQIEIIVPRHEQGLVHAADGYARATGKTGVCLVTSGPGATNLVTGIATANYDSVPLVCFTGQVARNLIGNDAFQEVDIIGITRNICKYGVTVRRREDLGRIIKEAFYIANTGKPGPVVIDLPKDVMKELDDAPYPETVNIRSYKPINDVHTGQIKRAVHLLQNAKRPVFLAGGGIQISRAQEAFYDLVRKTNVPVVTTIMGRGAIPTDSPYFIGNLGMHGSYAANMAVSQCDLLFSIGTRFNDRITGKIQSFASDAKIIHIDIDTASISRNIQVDVPVVADAGQAIEKLLEYAAFCEVPEWHKQIAAWDQDYPLAVSAEGEVTPKGILGEINAIFEESIVVSDVGQHQMWVSQFLAMNEKKRLLMSGGLGTMGYGLPGAIGAALGCPDKQIICVAGDGGIQMNIQEMATAVSQELPITICIFNNSYLGMVRQWQELFYGKRYSATCMKARKGCGKNCAIADDSCPAYIPDFVKLADSYGAKGIRVRKKEEIRPALLQAKENQTGPTIIEFIIEEDALVLPMVPGGDSLDQMILDC